MNRILFVIFSILIIIGCKSKKKERSDVPSANFLVNDYIKGRVSQLDTSQFSFLKIETVDGRSDTISIKSSDIHNYAKDFLTLPDLSSDELKDDYEVSHLYDEIQGAFVFTYTTKEAHKVREQHVTVEPEMNPGGQSNIRSVYVDFWDDNEAAYIRKNMMWEANSFYVTTTTEATGKEPKVKTIKIIWKDFIANPIEEK